MFVFLSVSTKAENNYAYISDHKTFSLSNLTLCTAAVGMAWSLLGSLRSLQTLLLLFQKHFVFWKYELLQNEQTPLGGARAAISPLTSLPLQLPCQTKGYSHLAVAMSLTQLGTRQLRPTCLTIQQQLTF